MISTITPLRLALIAGTAGLALGGGAQAQDRGLAGPGGDVHIWLGTGTDNWNHAANWNIGSIPGAQDVVIINGGNTNVSLGAHTPTLSSLFVAGGIALQNSNQRLDVTGAAGTTTVTGASSRIIVSGVQGGEAGFRTDTLDLESGGRLQMASGQARVSERLTMGNGASVIGRGLLHVTSNHPSAFAGLSGDAVTALNGDLTVRTNGGGIWLPQEIGTATAGLMLNIEGPVANEVRDVSLAADSVLRITSPWTLAGDMSVAGGLTRLAGGGPILITVGPTGAVDVDAGELAFQNAVNFASGSQASLAIGAAMTIGADGSDAQAGSSIEVQRTGTLRMDYTQPIGDFWSGTIELTASDLELARPGQFRVNGAIVMNSFGGLRSRIEGPGTLRLTGDMILPGGGGVIANTVELQSGGTIELGVANTVLQIDGELRQSGGGTISGPGVVRVNQPGHYRYSVPASMQSDIVNAGTVSLDSLVADVADVNWSVDYTQEPTGTLRVRVIGPGAGDVDRIETSGSATLAGAVEVELLGGFEPPVGTVYEIIDAAGGVSGSFGQVTGAPGFEVETVGDIVLLTYVGADDCNADFNGDGLVNFFDIQEFLNAYGDADPTADLTGDGLFNFFDIQAFLDQYNAGCP
jgi:hypothetical protein